MNRTHRTFALLCLAVALTACASAPKRSPELVRLENELTRLYADPRVAGNAELELARAAEVIELLQRNTGRLDRDWRDHNLHLADRRLRTAEAIGLARHAEDRGQALGAERDRLLVEVEARNAQRAAAEAQAARAEARAAQAEAALAHERARASEAELEATRLALLELEARATERGMVVTLGDVLFEVDRAELKPGAARSLDKLVTALRSDPSARVEIEGHTDSTGTRDYNLDLSARRAAAVQRYLVADGIDPTRIVARGLGPDYPVATNATAAGRQQNRRVEVIVETEVARDALAKD